MTNLSGANLNNGAAVGPQGEGRESPSTFPAYPAYKDSGVDWLGEVPEPWAIFSLKRSVDGCTNGLWGDETDGENDLAVIRVADFDRATCRVGLNKLTYRSITQKERASRLLQPGDLLIEKSGGGEKTLVGCVVLFEHDFEAITSNFVARMRPSHGFDSGFLCYSFDSLYQGKVNFPAIKQTTGIQNLDSESYLQERFCFPTLAEQTQIARFLDHETARIDALIEEQQRLIELLKEKRQAVISHAVTKGLDSTVPMKDSGVEWLGEVPAHWQVGALGYFAGIDTGATPDRGNPEYWGGDIPWIKTGEVNYENISQAEEYITHEGVKNSAAKVAPQGTLLMAMYGQGVTRGRVAILGIEAAYNQACAGIFVDSRIRVEYLRLFFIAAYPYIRDGGNETSQMNLSSGYIAKIKITIPSINEQVSVEHFLNAEMARYDSLIKEAGLLANHLQERRSALISAAVTGKIDVRGWQPPANAPTPESVQEAV